MKFSVVSKIFAALALVLFAAAFPGCTGTPPVAADPCLHTRYDGKAMEPYTDTTNKFAICVPEGLTRKGPAGFSDGHVEFSGFAVPAGTNLISKSLQIFVGADPNLQGPTPFGHFSAGGVNFTRAKVYDGSAGHMGLYIAYTGTVYGKTVHFDFLLFSVNPGVYDPGNRPAVYDEAAQVKLTEVIMGTFRTLP